MREVRCAMEKDAEWKKSSEQTSSFKGSEQIILPNQRQQGQSTSRFQPLQKYMWIGLMCFLVFVASITFAFLVLRFEDVLAGLQKLLGILEPIIVGLILAYILNPIMKWIENLLFKLTKADRANKKLCKRIRSVSLFFTIVLTIIFIAVLLSAVLPDLGTSIKNLVTDMPARFDTFTMWISNISINEEVDSYVQNGLSSIEKNIINWFQTGGKLDSIFSTLTDGVFGALNVIENLFLGLIVSVYVLSTKEKFKGQTKKILYAIFPKKTTNTILELARDSDRIFLGFLTGKVIDSLIIGCICFLFCYLVNMPYALIVSVIVGVTNIIPFFGPYIGGIPSALLILLANPKSGIIFIIFIIILQQVDGNFIGPKILGNSTGLSAFWVIFSILLGSGLFGFMGMIFGVPTFAVIYHIIKKVVNQKLKAKELPVDTNQYIENLEVSKVEVKKEKKLERTNKE